MEFSPLMQDHFPMRRFTMSPVEDHVLQDILEAARLAPSATGHQPHRILALRNRDSLRKLKTCIYSNFDAPLVLAVCCDTKPHGPRPSCHQRQGSVDMAIVATHIRQAARRHGLETAWVGRFDPDAFRTVFELPESVIPVALFPIGHPEPETSHASLRKPGQFTGPALD